MHQSQTICIYLFILFKLFLSHNMVLDGDKDMTASSEFIFLGDSTPVFHAEDLRFNSKLKGILGSSPEKSLMA